METVKKFFKTLLLLLLIAAMGAGIWHFAAPVREQEAPYIEFAGERIGFTSSKFRTPTLFGYLRKETVRSGNSELSLGKLDPSQLKLSVPEDYECSLVVKKEGEQYFSGGADDFEKQSFDNGEYTLAVNLHRPEGEDRDWVNFVYVVDYTVDIRPSAVFSAEKALQGDIITVRVNTGRSDAEPTISTALGKPVFAPLGNRNYVSYVPVGFAQTPGDYEIKVSAGGESFTGKLRVEEREYTVQNLTIDEDTASSTTGPGASIDFAQKITPTLYTSEKDVLWDGLFIQPVDGPITTEFGLFRYTNGSSRAERHTGIDIAAPAGTEVPASNGGKVVYAGDVISTGGSVVIEHGCGLKTYYYHLSSVDVKTGDIVKKGDIIGKVGSTGYSTGPHLHFEVKIGEYAVSPWELFDGSSSIYGGND